MQRMRTELLAWIMEANITKRGFAALVGKGRSYTCYLLSGKFNWSQENAELVDEVVGFSDEAWDEAYDVWESQNCDRWSKPSISQIIAQHKAANHPLHRRWV